jgi:hypothetical protein
VLALTMTLTMELNSRSLLSVGRTARCTNVHLSSVPSRRLSRSLQRHGLPNLHTTKHSRTRRFAGSNGDTAQVADGKQRLSIDLEPQAEGEYCMPGEVSLDNESHKDFTVLRVEVKDYPGLLRVIAWVINGLELVVQNARYGPKSHPEQQLLGKWGRKQFGELGSNGSYQLRPCSCFHRLKTQKDGIANNTFWITTDGGRKLDLKRAELVAERVGDFVIYCTPNQHAVEAQEFQEGPINLTNKEHDEYSVVSVVSEPNQKGFLLELASAMTGLGVTIHEAIIQVRPCSILHLNVVMALHTQTVHTCSSIEPVRHITLILYFASLLQHDLVTFTLTGLYMPLPVLCACCNFSCLQDRRPDL